MAAVFDVVWSSAASTWENTLLFPWEPQHEGCCHRATRRTRGQTFWSLFSFAQTSSAEVQQSNNVTSAREMIPT